MILDLVQTGSYVHAVCTGSNFGIGTDSPAKKLEVNSGTANGVALFTSTDTGANITLTDLSGSSVVETNATSMKISVDPDGAVADSDIRFQVDGSTKMVVDNTGYVGIATTNPQYQLDVDGHVKIASEKYYYTSGTGAGIGSDHLGNFKIRQNSADLIFGYGDNVGIGASAPGAKLTVAGNISAQGSLSAAGPNNNYFAGCVGIGRINPGSKLQVEDGGVRVGMMEPGLAASPRYGYSFHDMPSWGYTAAGAGGGLSARLAIFTDGAERISVLHNGSLVGIGEKTPGEALTVAGNISASGDGYFDHVIAGGYFEEKAANSKLAEYPTGSIVVIGKDGELELSTKSNDKMVFGVTKKGACQPIVLGAEPVLVTGDINVGDFITTSDKAGHGKVVLNTTHGSVIAQAMEAGCGCSYTLQAMIRKM